MNCEVQKYEVDIAVPVLQVRQRGGHPGAGRASAEGLHDIRGGAAGDQGSPLQETPARLLPLNFQQRIIIVHNITF